MKHVKSGPPMALRVGGALFIGLILVVVGLQTAFSKTAPAAPTLTTKPPSMSASTSATFGFTGPSGSTFRCSRDGAAFSVCTSTTAYSSLAQGAHTFSVKAVVGTDESAVTSYTWTVDTVPPAAPTLTGKPVNPSNTAAPSFSFSDADVTATFQCSMDGAVFLACTNPKSYSGMGQGSHTFQVLAVDPAGNGSGPTSYAWTVDTIAPAAPVFQTKPSDPTPNATNNFSWNASEGGLVFQCSLENGAWFGCSSPYQWQIATGNYGQHQIAVRGLDAAGNASPAATYSFKYEKGLPTSGVPFKISGTVDGLTIGVTKQINVTLSNQNTVPIYVSRVVVTLPPDSPTGGCSPSTNLVLTQSNVSATNMVLVPAMGVVTLPAQGVSAPTIQLKNLPTVNQDDCKNKTFVLTYSGTATN